MSVEQATAAALEWADRQRMAVEIASADASEE